MKSMSITRPEPGGQRGFSIVAALFILVVLAALGGYLVSTSSTQSLTLAKDFMNARAHLTARAGLDWGVYQVNNDPGGVFATSCFSDYGTTDPAPQILSALSGMPDFSVKVECQSAVYQEGDLATSPSYRVYQITATACNAAACPAATPGLGYVEHRQVGRVRQ